MISKNICIAWLISSENHRR